MRENPPDTILFEALTRDIMAKPRVTRFLIKWCVFLVLILGGEVVVNVFFCACVHRDVPPQAQSGQVAMGAAQSAAVPSADDLEMEEPQQQQQQTTKPHSNGIAA